MQKRTSPIPKYDPATTTLTAWLTETAKIAAEKPALRDRIRKARAEVLSPK